MTPQEAHDLKNLAKEGVISRSRIPDLERELKAAKKEAGIWKSRYEKLYEQSKDFLTALKRAPRKVKEFIQFVLHTEPEQTDKPKSRETHKQKSHNVEL